MDEQNKLPPTAADVAAGLDLSQPLTTNGMPSPIRADVAAEEGLINNIELANRAAGRSTAGLLGDAALMTLTGDIARYTFGKQYEADPSFTTEQFKAKYDEAIKKLPEEFHRGLWRAGSADHFDALVEQAQDRVKKREDLARQGWGITAADYLISFLDPTTLAIGIGTGMTAPRYVARGLGLGPMATRGLYGVGGGIGGVTIEGLSAATGAPVTDEQLLWAAALGTTLGVVLGPLGSNPHAQAEAGQFLSIAQRLKDRFDAMRRARAEAENPPPRTQAEAKRAAEAAQAEAPPTTTDPQKLADEMRALQEAANEPPKLTPEQQKLADEMAALQGGTPEKLPPRGEPPLSEADRARRGLAQLNGEAPPTWKQSDIEWGLQSEVNKNGVEALRARLEGLPDEALALLAQNNRFNPTPGAARQQLIDELVAEGVRRRRDRFGGADGGDGIRGATDAVDANYRKPPNPNDATQVSARQALIDEARSYGIKVIDGESDASIARQIQRAKDKGVQPKGKEAPQPAKPAQPAERIPAPEGVLKSRFVDAYRGSDGEEYLILKDGEELDQFRVVRPGGRGVVAEGLPTIDDAKAKIPGLSNPVDDLAKALQEGDAEKAAQSAVQALKDAVEGKPKAAAEPAPGASGGALLDDPQQVHTLPPMTYDDGIPPPGAGGAAPSTNPGPMLDAGLIQDTEIPFTGGFWRWDRAGILGKAMNPVTRLLGSALLNDTVGKARHVVNTIAAEIERDIYYARIFGEYNRVRRVAFVDWAEEQGLTPWERITRQNEFYEDVGLYIADRVEGRQYSEHVMRLGEHVKTLQKEILEDLKNPLRYKNLVGRPVRGSEDVEENLQYLWRKIDGNKVRGFMDEYRYATVREGNRDVPVLELLVRQAIREAQPDLDEAFLNRLAQGYVAGINRRANGLGDAWSQAIGWRSMERFRAAIAEDFGLRLDNAADVAQLDALMARMEGMMRPAGADMSNLKRRTLLSEKAEITIESRNGTPVTLRFSDILDNNVDRLFQTYARRAAGRIALGRIRITDPADGRILIDGITSDAEFERLLTAMKEWQAGSGLDAVSMAQMAKDEANLRFAYDRVIAHPDPEQLKDYAQWLRRIRAYMTTRLLGQVGIAQLGEWGTPMAALGLKATFSHIPAIRRVVTDAGESVLQSAFFREIEAMGIGIERLHGIHYQTLDDVSELPFGVDRVAWRQRLDDGANFATRATYELSGMSIIQQQQERHVAAAIFEKLGQHAMQLQNGGTIGRGAMRRYAQLGIDEQMLQRIFSQFKQHVTDIDGPFTGKRITRLNVGEWTDQEARAVMEAAVFRYTKKLIQAQDIGSAAFWMSNPVAQTIFQFRGFSFTAWNNQFLYGLHMADPAAVATFAWQMAWNAMVRAGQVQLLSSTRSDRDKYLEKNLSVEELAKAGFSRAGWASVLPMVIDTAAVFGGYEGQFNARSTGQASDIAFGSPALSFIDTAAKGIGGIANAARTGRSVSQPEWRNAVGVLPGQNLLPFAMALSLIIKDAPEKAPRKNPQ